MALTPTPRIGVVGHHTWFSNHFPEGWETDKNVFCLDVDERDYRFLIHMANFRPDLTLFYRPELYPPHYLDMISGTKVAILSEPVPPVVDGRLVSSPETDLRLLVYKRMNWPSYDKVIYYDPSKRASIQMLGWPVSSYRPMPIDTHWFHPRRAQRPIDVCFIGKATDHRIRAMDFLRLAPWRFVWIAHGVSGKELAAVLRRTKVALNIHADALPAIEPRVFLAAACGCVVLSEPFPGDAAPLDDRVIRYDGALTLAAVEEALALYERNAAQWRESKAHEALGVRKLIDELIAERARPG